MWSLKDGIFSELRGGARIVETSTNPKVGGQEPKRCECGEGWSPGAGAALEELQSWRDAPHQRHRAESLLSPLLATPMGQTQQEAGGLRIPGTQQRRVGSRLSWG